MRFHWNIAAFFILLYFELVKGNPEHWSALVDISSHHFVHLFWGTLSLIFGAGATVGVVVGEGVGQQHASLCADWLCRLMESPLGFVQAAWADWFIHLCPGSKLWAKAHPHYPAQSECWIRKNNLPEQVSGNFEIKLVRLHRKPLPLQGKPQQMQRRLS